MKIQTLLELIDTEVSTIKSDNNFKADKDDRVKKRAYYDPKIKSGYYGRVHDGGDAHTINKVPFKPEKDGADGYYEYIKYIVEHKLYDTNPYAPRIYKFKTIKDGNNHIKYKIELEKLTPFRSLDKRIARSIGESMVGGEEFDNNVDNWERRMGEEVGTHIAVSKVLEQIINGNLISDDENLQQICKIIQELSYDVGADVDVHNGNIMVRLSPYPQLVIVDPLAQ